MNPWDLVTWIACGVLAGSAVLIFGFFLRDLPSILHHEMHDPPDGAPPRPPGEE